MRNLLLLCLVTVLLSLASCKTTAHGGNCGCPHFGQVNPQETKTQPMASGAQHIQVQ